jgi:hypothetical protein
MSLHIKIMTLMQLLLKKLLLILGFVLYSTFPTIAMAQAAAPPTIQIKAGVGFSTLGQALNTIIEALFLLGGLLAFGYILYGAIKYITAGDNSANVGAARTTMQNAVIGLIVLSLVFVIFKFAVNLIPGLGAFFA